MVLSMLIVAYAPLGYAYTSYSATTVSSNNSISAEYFTIGLYTKTDDTYSPISSAALLSKPIYKSGSNTVSGNNELSADNLFIKITNSNAASLTFTLSTPSFSLMDDGTPISGVNYILKIGDATYTTSTSSWTSSSVLPNQYYSVKLTADFTTTHTIVTTSGAFMGMASIVVTGTRTGSSLGRSFAESHSCSIEASTPVHEMEVLNDNVVSDQSKVTNTNDIYCAADPPEDRKNSYGNHESVTIIANTSGGISKQDPDDPHNYVANVTLNIPVGKRFIIGLVTPPQVNGTYRVTITYGYDDESDVSYTTQNGVSISNGYNQYLGLSGSTVNKHTTFNSAMNYWFPIKPNSKVNTPDYITVEIKNYYQQTPVNPRIGMDLIFDSPIE